MEITYKSQWYDNHHIKCLFIASISQFFLAINPSEIYIRTHIIYSVIKFMSYMIFFGN